MNDPDLSDLSVFVAVTEVRSFRAAARLRGVSASALSEVIRQLEARLDVRLLNRTTLLAASRSRKPASACWNG